MRWSVKLIAIKSEKLMFWKPFKIPLKYRYRCTYVLCFILVYISMFKTHKAGDNESYLRDNKDHLGFFVKAWFK